MDDLRDRLVRTRWPEPEPVGDWSQGVPLRRLRELCRYRALSLLAAGGAFHVVVPSLPGYAFSGKPTATGWSIHRIARAWCELMTRLGYDRFVAGGSDWGSSISTSIALQLPERLLGPHLVPPLVAPAGDDRTEAERGALRDLDERARHGSGYSAMHGTRPQTIGYALLDSPAGLAAAGSGWSAQHDSSLTRCGP